MNGSWTDWTYHEVPRYRVAKDIREAGEEAVAVARRCLHLPPIQIHWMRRLPTKGRGRERRLWAWAKWRRWGTPETLEDWKQEIVRDQFERSLVRRDQPILGLAHRDHPGEIWLMTNTAEPFHNPDQVWRTALHECRHLAQFRDEPVMPEPDYPTCPPLPHLDPVMATAPRLDQEWIRRLAPAQARATISRNRDEIARHLAECEGLQSPEERDAYHAEMVAYLAWVEQVDDLMDEWVAAATDYTAALDEDAERFAHALWLSLRGTADLIRWDLSGDLKVLTAGTDWVWWSYREQTRRERAARRAAKEDQAA